MGFQMPFGGHLSKDNRWVKLAGIMPWDQIEEIYAASMSHETGRGHHCRKSTGHQIPQIIVALDGQLL